ncbi:MAG: 4'-phosphopantetheinyl transferase superfamily protein, partial [Betaproteobacteria bacterium]
MSVQTLVLKHGEIEQRVCFAAASTLPAEEFLSEKETKQLAGFKFAAKREGYLLGRLAAKHALASLLAEPDLRQIEIRAGVYGQPLVQHPRAADAEVTVSHSHGLAVALAFPAQYPMGIDLETISAVAAQVVIGELEASPPELTWLATGGADAATACCVLWTAREALGKALKIGLNSPLGMLSLTEIRATSENSWACRYLNFPRCQCLSWVAGGRVLSLAMHHET